ncbi:hypothetical protein KI387_019894, partial [Taxus chinensis]
MGRFKCRGIENGDESGYSCMTLQCILAMEGMRKAFKPLLQKGNPDSHHVPFNAPFTHLIHFLFQLRLKGSRFSADITRFPTGPYPTGKNGCIGVLFDEMQKEDYVKGL